MTESDIMHERGMFWVSRDRTAYTVWRIGATHSTSDSAYKKTPDGLSLAIARCNYLARCAAECQNAKDKHGFCCEG